MIKKVVFCGDLIRQSLGFSETTDFLIFNLFKRQIESVIDMPVELHKFSEKKFDIFTFLKICNMELSQQTWCNIFSGQFSKEGVSYFKECFKDCFLIFQEAGCLQKIAKQANIPFLNIYISPIRFLEDIHFCFQSNISQICKVLSKYVIKESKIYLNANRVKAYYWRRYPDINSYTENSILLCGQTGVDLSLIKNGKLVSFSDFIDKIKELSSNYCKIYYKPHPFAQSDNDGEQIIRSMPNIEIVNDNFYKMVSSNNISAVAAISSGVLHEAPYFGKDVSILSHKYNTFWKEGNKICEDDYFTIDNQYYSSKFWSEIFYSLCSVKKGEYFEFDQKDNFLRDLSGLYWGYEINAPKISKKGAIKQPIKEDKQSNIKRLKIEKYLNKTKKHTKSFFKPISKIISWVFEPFKIFINMFKIVINVIRFFPRLLKKDRE